MSGQHLGDTIHDLLDNRLSAARTAESMRHLDDCGDCRLRWDDLRNAREALQTSSAGIDLTFSQDLLDRDRIAEIARDEPKQQARAASGRTRRPVVMTTLTVLVAVSISVGAAYVAGAPTEVSLEFADEPTVIASAGRAETVQIAAGPQSSSTVAYMGATSMRGGEELRNWVHPDWKETGVTPVEASVITTRDGDTVLVASLLFDRYPIVITEQHGQLSSALIERSEAVDLGHTQGYILSESPRQLVWQTGDVVISATCSCPLATLKQAAECFPAQEDPHFVARVLNGFRELTGFAAE